MALVDEQISNVVPITAQPKRRKPPRAGMGRPKGSQNKISRGVREAIESAFAKVGGDDYLVEVARTEPAIFCALLAKLLPLQALIAEHQAEPPWYKGKSIVAERIRALIEGSP